MLGAGNGTKFQLLPLFDIVGPFLGSNKELGGASRGIKPRARARVTSWEAQMAPKKNHKQAQDSMLEKLVKDCPIMPESIGEEQPRPQEDQDELESEEEQRSSVLFTPEQLEVVLKMNRPDFGELVVALKGGSSKNAGFQLAKPWNFDAAHE